MFRSTEYCKINRFFGSSPDGLFMKTRSLNISGEETIQCVQNKFSELFPLLTIHFYSLNEKVSSDDSCVMLSPKCKIADVIPQFRNSYIPITENMMVYELENAIYHNFGLHAEISGKSGNQRILTSPVSRWLLNEKYPRNNHQSGYRSDLYFRNIPFGC
jgi:hypothetical protein